MTDAATLTTWVQGYQKAWDSNAAEDLRSIFTDDATYSGRPHDQRSWNGIGAIIAGWTDHADSPGSYEFEWHPVAIDGDTAVAQAVVVYDNGTTWDDLWVIRFAADGRAIEFTEWPIERE